MKKAVIVVFFIILTVSLSGCFGIEKTISGRIIEMAEYENDYGITKMIIEKDSGVNTSYLVFTDDVEKYKLQEGDDVILKFIYDSGDNVWHIDKVWIREK